MSAADSGAAWDLRCEVRERLREKVTQDATPDRAMRGPPVAPDDARESAAPAG